MTLWTEAQMNFVRRVIRPAQCAGIVPDDGRRCAEERAHIVRCHGAAQLRNRGRPDFSVGRPCISCLVERQERDYQGCRCKKRRRSDHDLRQVLADQSHSHSVSA